MIDTKEPKQKKYLVSPTEDMRQRTKSHAHERQCPMSPFQGLPILFSLGFYAILVVLHVSFGITTVDGTEKSVTQRRLRHHKKAVGDLNDKLEENTLHILSLKCSHFFLGGKPRFGGDRCGNSQ